MAEDSEKEKKRKKRIRDMLMHLQFNRLRENVDISAPDEPRPQKGARPVKSEECSKKLATVHQSIELRRRMAQDRWNRFAGTSDGGGRGR